jgi:hypothetical protein
MDRARWPKTLLLGVTYALRGLRRWPGFTLLSVLLLAAGTGATTPLVSLVAGAVLLTLILCASRLPARAALRIEPSAALRGD